MGWAGFGGRVAMKVRVAHVAAAVAALLVFDVIALTTHDAAHRRPATRSTNAEPSPVAPPSTSTTIPLPPKLAFGRRPPTAPTGPPELIGVLANGSGLAPTTGLARPDVEISKRRGLMVYRKGLNSETYAGGTSCAFYRCTQYGTTVSEAGIAVVDLDGTNERVLTSGGYDHDPAFSPDGEVIAFLRHLKLDDGSVGDAIAFMQPDGTILGGLLPEPKHTYTSFAWAPDGRAVAVAVDNDTSTDDETKAEVDLLAVGGSVSTKLADGTFYDLAFAHDGHAVVGARDRLLALKGYPPFSPVGTMGRDLWVLPVDIPGPVQITHVAPAKPAPLLPSCNSNSWIPGFTQPVWSTDDKQIAALSNYRHTEGAPMTSADVVVLNADGTDVHPVYGQRAGCGADPQGGLLLELYGWRFN